jgi:hypothetical protein
MTRMLGLVGETLGETLGGSVLVPLLVGGVVVATAVSPAFRKRLRRLGVRGVAAAMATREMAMRNVRGAGDGAAGVVTQLGQRVMQAAAEAREEWDDFVAEARALRTTPASKAAEVGAEREENRTPRRNGARRPRRAPRARRAAE